MVLKRIENIEIEARRFSSVTLYGDAVVEAYYNAIARGLESNLVKERIKNGLRFLSGRFISPHEKGAVEAYFTSVVLGVAPKTAMTRVNRSVSAFNQDVPPTVRGVEGLSRAYYFAVSVGVPVKLASDRLRFALRNLNNAENIFLEELAQEGYYTASALGVPLKETLERISRGRDFFREEPSYNRPKGLVSSFYSVVALNDLYLLTELVE